MAYVTRAMRQKQADETHEARHPERAAERIRYRKASEQALAELHARWPQITPENFEEANRFRETRTQELMKDSASHLRQSRG